MRRFKHTVLLTLSLALLSACGTTNPYQNFLNGDLSQVDEASVESFFLKEMASGDTRLGYEYLLMDLDGDGSQELLIQYVDDPGSFNAVFHYENDKIVCWCSDSMEMICYSYPLKNGMMVEEYDYDGSISYNLYRYLPSGETEQIGSFFIREEPSSLEESLDAPIYKIDNENVSKEEFEKELKEQVLDEMVSRNDWTKMK